MLVVLIQNDGTGDEIRGNYDWEVLINKTQIAKGRVEKFYRPDGAAELIKLVGFQAQDKVPT